LVLLQKIFGISEPPIFFDTMVHLGTLIAVLLFFGGELRRVVGVGRVVGRVAIGTLPAVVVGVVVQSFFVEKIFGSLALAGLGFLVTGALLLWSRKIEKGINPAPRGVRGKRGIKGLKDTEALVIGCFQEVAILPGISRSGATIVGGLSQKLSREGAFKFSFYLSIPAIIGANILQLKDFQNFEFLPQGLLGMVVAFGVGYFSLRALRRILQAEKLYYFSFYCFLISLLTFFKILF